MPASKFSPEIQSLFEQLINAESPLEQIQAAYAIGEAKNKEEALKALIKGLVLPDSEVKLTILEIFSNPDFFSSEITLPVCDLLEDEDPEVKTHSSELLGMLKDSRSVASLIKLIEDKESSVRYSAMAALANIGDVKASSSLEKVLESSNWEDRFNAIDAIGMLADPSSLQGMLKALTDSDYRVRENAALSVGHFKNSQIVDKLISLIDDEAAEVQAAAAYTLGGFKSQEAIKPLINLLKSEEEEVAVVACEALGKIKEKTTIPVLIEMLHHSGPEVVKAAEDALDSFNDRQLVEPFIDAILKDVKVRFGLRRIAKYTDQKIPLQELKKLKQPLWFEMLMNELSIMIHPPEITEPKASQETPEKQVNAKKTTNKPKNGKKK